MTRPLRLVKPGDQGRINPGDGRCLRKDLIVLAQNRRHSKLGALSPMPAAERARLGAGLLLRFPGPLERRLRNATQAEAGACPIPANADRRLGRATTARPASFRTSGSKFALRKSGRTASSRVDSSGSNSRFTIGRTAVCRERHGALPALGSAGGTPDQPAKAAPFRNASPRPYDAEGRGVDGLPLSA